MGNTIPPSCWYYLLTGAKRYISADAWLGRTVLAPGEPGVVAVTRGIRDSQVYGKQGMARDCSNSTFTFTLLRM